MTKLVLVTGGTGTVGRVVVERLRDMGVQVRVLSRGRRRIGPGQHVVGDVRTGDGLAEAVAGVETIVHCVDPADRLVQAAVQAGIPHLVYISIVGVDRVPLGYYRRKLADEQLIAASGLGWTVLRTTQFHDLVAAGLRLLAKPPVMAVPSGWCFQPVDVREVANQLASLAQGEPAGRVPDMAGPEVRRVQDLARGYLSAVGTHRLMLSVPFPGRVARAYHDGAHLAPERAVGTIGFEEYLTEQLAAGTVPYDDAIRAYTRRPPRQGTR